MKAFIQNFVEADWTYQLAWFIVAMLAVFWLGSMLYVSGGWIVPIVAGIAISVWALARVGDGP